MSRSIEVIVSPSGQVQVETRGFEGASCREASRFLEEALGTRGRDLNTAEFFQTAESQSLRQQTG